MIKKSNVTVGLDEIEYEVLVKLNEELSKRSYKKPSISETVKFAIKFTEKNVSSRELVEDLKNQLEAEKRINLLKRHLLSIEIN